MSNIQLFDNAKSVQDCIDEAYDSFNVPRMGGASLDGWSKMYDFQRCPYRYWALHEQTKETDSLVQIGSKPAALEIGALYHALLACHYIGSTPVKAERIKPRFDLGPTQVVQVDKIELAAQYAEYPTAFELLNRVRALGGDGPIADECERLYIAYFNQYGNPANEGISPLAIELPAGKPGVHTCRFDLLASIHGGTWIVEHKTASRETRDVLESWWLDGEIIGEVYGYKLSGLEAIYGPLVGVLVNVIIKTNVPKFRRIEVVIPDSLVERYAEDMRWWKDLRRISKETNRYPRKLQGCIGRYDTCQLWDHCRDAEATDSDRLTRLLQASIDTNNQR